MARSDRTRSAIIDYWRSVELFSPPAIDKVDHRKRMFRAEVAAPLPWEPEHALAQVALKPHQVWQHSVYLGCYRLEHVTDVIKEIFGEDEGSYDGRLGESALAAIVVDADGSYVDGSFILSSCAWGTGQLLRSVSSLDLDDVQREQAALGERVARLLTPPAVPENGEQPTEPVTIEALCAVREMVGRHLGVTDRLAAQEIRIKSVLTSRRRPADTADDFLNSFLLEDLGRVAAAARANRCGTALRAYLGDDRAPHRADLRKNPALSFTAVRPQAVPSGRWPGDPGHALALSQQYAVNEVLAGGPPTGIFAVNGPPGTGKTTMLRDLVAAIVVRRAEALAALPRPADAFTGKRIWQAGDRPVAVRTWRPELVGHEIVVASSNNGAVENVSLEMPLATQVDVEHFGETDHFTDIATTLLRVAQKRRRVEAGAELPPEATTDVTTAWALVAAVLGKKANRADFASVVWFGRSADDGGDDDPPTVLEWLRSNRGTVSVPSWPECVARFRARLDRATEGGRARDAVYQRWCALSQARRARPAAEQAAREADEQIGSLRDRLRGVEDQLVVVEEELRTTRESRSHHLRFRPGAFRALIDRRRAGQWQDDDDVLAGRIRAVEEHQHELRRARDRFVRAGQAAEHDRTAALDRVAALDRTIREAATALERAHRRWGDAVPDVDRWGTDVEAARRERSAPWLDPEWNAERSEVFRAALRLHHDFLAHQAGAMLGNLGTAMNILSGTAPRDLAEDIARAAWQSLFFLVPVVSTTFASAGRMFSHLTSEALGWLFVDEAGQATPQNAVGALWRCRRAVVVGDPFQLEPVLTLPLTAQQALRLAAGVDERWLPARLSVQTLADELMPVGTVLRQGDDEQRWVGAPLRVHRRCDEPMFGVVNRIAYDDMMIPAVARRDDLRFRNGRELPTSKWLHVTGTARGNWVPAEGERLKEMLAYMAEHDFDMSSVMVVGPFRDVRDGIRPIIRGHPGVRGGTIHTAQGKEADVVVLVLGSDPSADGARRWASGKPNLVNVAVSRARRRLYVIGDRDVWQGYPYFGELARALPVLPER